VGMMDESDNAALCDCTLIQDNLSLLYKNRRRKLDHRSLSHKFCGPMGGRLPFGK